MKSGRMTKPKLGLQQNDEWGGASLGRRQVACERIFAVPLGRVLHSTATRHWRVWLPSKVAPRLVFKSSRGWDGLGRKQQGSNPKRLALGLAGAGGCLPVLPAAVA